MIADGPVSEDIAAVMVNDAAQRFRVAERRVAPQGRHAAWLLDLRACSTLHPTKAPAIAPFPGSDRDDGATRGH
jgi:hypothetical protein